MDLALIPWQLAVAATGFISAIAQGIGKRQVTYMSAFQSGLIRDLTILLIIVTISLSQSVIWSAYSLVFVFVGFLESIMMAAYYSASREEMTATTAFSYPFSGALIVISSAVLFGEWRYFDPHRIAGIVNILVTLITILMVGTYQKGKAKLSSWNIKLILSASMVVVANLVQKWAMSSLGIKPNSYMLFEYLGLVAGGIIFVYGRHLNLRLRKTDFGWGIAQGALYAVSALWYTQLLIIYPLSLSSVIRRLTIVMATTFISLFIFAEHRQMTRGKYLQIGLGIVMLVLSFLFNQ